MLNDMDSKSEQALKELATQAKEATMNMEREEAAEFFDRLADWAYTQHEACLIDPELEMQDYDNEE
jgi:excinuclease UvrABC nuclease subunit|nr:MAG TPA: hypothetical protein [Caudoviricetes sp.]